MIQPIDRVHHNQPIVSRRIERAAEQPKRSQPAEIVTENVKHRPPLEEHLGKKVNTLA
jgi:hypothetical protein